MIRSLVRKAVCLGIVTKNDAEIFEYGLADLSYTIFTWSFVLLIALCMHKIGYMLLFMLMHIPLRIYAGGMHLSTRFRCFCVSLLIFAFVFMIPCFFTVIQLGNAIPWLVIPCALIIWKFAPVEDLRKPLNNKERNHHRKVSLAICAVGLAIISVFYFLHYYQMVYFMGAAIMVVSFQLVLGYIKISYYSQK